jgi:periplasmic mercuric ion binding protein
MKYIFLAFLNIMLSLNMMAQNKTVIIKTPGITCEDCEAYVENRMMNLHGILEIDVNPWGKTTRVVFMPTRTDANTVRLIIANLGFVADTMLPTDLRFVTMPQCCRETAKKSYEVRLAENVKLRKTVVAPVTPAPVVVPVNKPVLPVKPTLPVKPAVAKPGAVKPTVVKPAAAKPTVMPKPPLAKPIKKG